MNASKYKLSSRLFLMTGVINILFAFVVKLFLSNPDIGKRFTNFNKEFLISDIYLIIGAIWLMFSALYLIDDHFGRRLFSKILKYIHFFFTLPMIIILLLTPILETYYPTNGHSQDSFFYNLFSYSAIFATFGIIIGTCAFLINFIRGLLSLAGMKLE